MRRQDSPEDAKMSDSFAKVEEVVMVAINQN